MSLRPRRSALYMPASNARAVAKAATLDADVIILDLEDAVAPEAKEMAREHAGATVLGASLQPREVVIRVNGLDTPWGEADLADAVRAAPDAILVPKVSSAAEVRRYDRLLAAAPDRTRLWTMIETARSIFELDAIAACAAETRLAAFVLGVNDLAQEMQARLLPGRAPFLGMLGLAVAAARAHDLAVLDGVYNGLDDAEGLAAECSQAVEFGFDGKTLIHPSQLEIANRAFTPDAAEVARARAIVAAFSEPGNAALGAIRVDGRMVERLHLRQAWRTLAIAEAVMRR